jgi:hypothetical protein
MYCWRDGFIGCVSSVFPSRAKLQYISQLFCQLAGQKPGVLDELAAERSKQLEIENAELEKQADKLAKEIKKLSGKAA